ncbi:MAG: hypothetical protein GY703_00665, partial [Gammaproteobacteria bacterium]|nr:hypothetical protein [Gammaproteobacteria bacterium]
MTGGSGLPEGTGGRNTLGCEAEGCGHNCIAEVFFPNVGSNPVKQFVNLPRESRFQGSSSEHQDRLTNQVRVGVRFQRAVSGSVNFQIELVPETDNAEYSNTEQGRSHNRYRFTPETAQTHTISSGDRMVIEPDLSLTVAGGDTYRVKATCDQGHEHLSRPIEIWRRVWLQEIQMNAVPAASSIQPFINYYQDNHNLV